MKRNVFIKGLLGLMALALLLTCFGAALAEDQSPRLNGPVLIGPYVPEGEALGVRLPDAVGIDSYTLYFCDIEDHWKPYSGSVTSGKYAEGVVDLPTDGVPKGLQTVHALFKDADGHVVTTRSRVVKVTDGALPEDGVTVEVYPAAAKLNQTAMLWVYAPGAEGLAVNMDNGDVWTLDDEIIGYIFGYDTPVDFDITATAYYPDGDVKTSDAPVHFSTAADGAAFDFQPAISEISEDGKLTVDFDKVTLSGDRNVFYDVSVWGIDDDYDVYWSYRNQLFDGDAMNDTVRQMPDGTERVVFDGLEPNKVYGVYVGAYAEGTPTAAIETRRQYRTGTDDQIVLKVNGTPAAENGKLEVKTHETYYVRVEFPEDATLIRLFNGEEFIYPDDMDECREQGYYWSESWDHGWPEYRMLYAQYTTQEIEDVEFEDLAWSDPSDAVQVTVIADGDRADECALTLDADSVPQGQPLSFRLDMPEGVKWAWVYARRIGTDEDAAGLSVYNAGDGASASLPTGGMAPGWYMLGVNCIPNDIGRVESQRFAFFRVTEPEWDEDAFYIDVSPTEGVYAHQEIAVSAHKKGADAMRLMVDNGDDVEERDSFDGDSFSGTIEEGAGTVDIWAEAYFEATDEWVRSEKVSVEFIGREWENPIEIEVEDVVAAGEDVALTVRSLDQCDDHWWDIHVTKIVPDDDWVTAWRVCRNDQKAADTGCAFTIPADVLEPGFAYEISVWADARFTGGMDANRRIYVSGAGTDENIALTAEYDGNTYEVGDTVEPLRNDDIRLFIEAPGAYGIRVFRGDNWEIIDDFDAEEGRGEHGIDFDTDCSVFVNACYDEDFDRDNWEEANWSDAISGAIHVRLWSFDEELADPVFTLEQDDEPLTLTRGEMLSGVLYPAEDDSLPYGEDISVFIRAAYGEEWRNDNEWNLDRELYDLPADFAVSTVDMPAGENYRLVIESHRTGYEPHRITAKLFNIVEPEEVPDGIQLELLGMDSPEAQAEDADFTIFAESPFKITAFAPGADHIDMSWTCLDDDGAEVDRWTFGESGVSNYEEGREGLFEVEAISYDGADNELARKSLTVRIVPRGQLEAPEIEAAGLAKFDEDFTFTVDKLEQDGVGWWWITVNDTDTENDWEEIFYADRNGSDNYSFTIPEGTLQSGHAYIIEAHVHGRGWDGGDYEARFVAYASQQDVTLLVNGDSAEASGYCHVDEDWKIVISAPGATAVRFFNGDGWDHYNDLDEDGNLTLDGYWFDSRDCTVVAQACYDEDVDWNEIYDYWTWNTKLNWTNVSNPVHIMVVSEGEALGVELDQAEYTVSRGSVFHFQVTGVGDLSDERHGTDFHAYIVNDNWDWDGGNDANFFIDEPEKELPYDVYLSTGYLDPEERYWLVVDSCAPKYDWVDTRVPLYVAEPEDPEFVFEVQEGELIDQMPFRISAYAPGADEMYVYVVRTDEEESFDWGPWPGDYINGNDMSLEYGEYDLTAVAYKDGEVLRQSETLSISVDAYGDLDEPVFTIWPPSPANVNERHIIGIQGLELGNDNWFDVRIHIMDKELDEPIDEDDRSMIWRVTRDEEIVGIDEGVDDDGVHWFSIPAGTLVAGESYHIDAWVDKDGYRGASNWIGFLAGDGEVDESITLTVNGSDDKVTVDMTENATIRIEYPVGTTALRFWNGDDWEYRVIDPETDTWEETWSWGAPRIDLDAFASVTSDPLNIDWDSFDWNWEALGLNWSAPGNVVKVDVLNHGVTGGTLTVTTDTGIGVPMGQDVNVTVDLADVAIENPVFVVDVSIRDAELNEVGQTFDRYYDVTFPFNATIHTDSIGEAGRYRVVVSVSAVGYYWNETFNGDDSHLHFTYFDPDQVLVLPAFLKEIEDNAFEGVSAQLIVLPEGIESVGEEAFANCPNLLSVASPIGITETAFNGCAHDVAVDRF